MLTCMVICLERGADLHMAQLMPLPLTVSCFSKIQIGFTFLVPADPGSPRQRAVKRACVRACVYVCMCGLTLTCGGTMQRHSGTVEEMLSKYKPFTPNDIKIVFDFQCLQREVIITYFIIGYSSFLLPWQIQSPSQTKLSMEIVDLEYVLVFQKPFRIRCTVLLL